jgi:predicted Zn-ribbon and HTH transcriptional regulator
MMTQQEYVESKGTRCPKCRSDQIEGDSLEVDGTDCTQDILCRSCGFGWTDVYTLVGYVPEEENRNG